MTTVTAHRLERGHRPGRSRAVPLAAEGPVPSACRSPLGFLLHFKLLRRLRDVRVGAYHGGYCVGCCWSLMLVLVAVGVMNMAWMAA